jgi:DNA-directed RNA polymerase subunit E'/Rpb7
MDPLFERRELVRNVHVESRFLQRNIYASILGQLRSKYEGVCVAEGFIQPQSIVIVEHSMGRMNLIRGGIDYVVRFQADVCFPHPNQVFRAPVSLKSKIGVHAEMLPVKVLLPRDLHIGVPEFEDVKENETVEFRVIGSRFQQGDETIVVLGKLEKVIQPEAPAPVAENVETAEPLIAASTGAPAEDEKRVVTVEVSSTKPTDATARRKRIRLNPAATTNE